MTKTIEEAAREFAEENWTDFRACEWPKEYVTENLEYAFEEGAAHVLSLPLSQRLTDEEREKMRKMYSEAQSWLDEKPTLDGCNSYLRVCAVAIQSRLESIFGKELFGEE